MASSTTQATEIERLTLATAALQSRLWMLLLNVVPVVACCHWNTGALLTALFRSPVTHPTVHVMLIMLLLLLHCRKHQMKMETVDCCQPASAADD